jgi:lipopolysaccharide transport system permease protein
MHSMTRNENVIVYSAEASKRSIVAYLNIIMHELPQSHELGFRLFKRNLIALYRQSLFGFGWALLPPLATAALWIFLRGNNVVSMDDTGVRYPVFVITGTLLWQVFSEAISAPLSQVTENKAMLSKINIPREGLLLSGLYQLIFNIIIKVLLLVGVFLIFHQAVSFSSVAFVPVGLFAIGLAGFSVGLLLTPLGMLYQDVNRGLTVLLPFLMYLTPTVYPAPREGVMGLVMKFNPIANFITQTRNWFLSQPVYDMQYFWIYLIGFTLIFLIALVVYRLSMPMIIERIGS